VQQFRNNFRNVLTHALLLEVNGSFLPSERSMLQITLKDRAAGVWRAWHQTLQVTVVNSMSGSTSPVHDTAEQCSFVVVAVCIYVSIACRELIYSQIPSGSVI
jgi:hypothetical protein